jgi:hypothetical protein
MIDIYIWFVSLYLYTVNITIISYCKIVYFNHIFHCNLCNEEIKKWMNEWMNEWGLHNINWKLKYNQTLRDDLLPLKQIRMLQIFRDKIWHIITDYDFFLQKYE